MSPAASLHITLMAFSQFLDPLDRLEVEFKSSARNSRQHPFSLLVRAMSNFDCFQLKSALDAPAQPTTSGFDPSQPTEGENCLRCAGKRACCMDSIDSDGGPVALNNGSLWFLRERLVAKRNRFSS